ncbi:MAG TPA: flagellar hook-associated protein 3 [Spirochaetota bacterium]|nr:flagellar hook-associated protein 3 [Spirochaetota bacterium]HPS85626.1 flagellar hook-associated protein 3 [Spirochaetota bacterium]
MNRITNSMINNTMTFNLQRHQTDMDTIQNQLATGKTVQTPRDNPIAASNQMLYRTRLTEIDQYISNINETQSRLNEVDTALQSTTRIFQRIRELAVQGANGIYSNFERKEAAAAEINQLLEEVVSLANTRGATGKSIFGGFKTGTEDQPNPFVPIYMTLTAGRQGDAMIGVEYRGNIGGQTREVGKNDFMDVNIPGNKVFWATDQVLTSSQDATNYSSASNQVIKIDGKEISISAGDNIDIIVDKINNAGLSLTAAKGGVNNLILSTTAPHQIWVEDKGSGTVLQDLGIINKNYPQPPNNIDSTVTIGGMSIFEMIIQVRDDLVRGDQELVGGRDLGLIDMALDNILKHLASTGAKQNRAEELAKKAEYEKGNVTEILAKNEGIDYPETIMNFKWLESVHEYALSVGAKTIKSTLMDFLR